MTLFPEAWTPRRIWRKYYREKGAQQKNPAAPSPGPAAPKKGLHENGGDAAKRDAGRGHGEYPPSYQQAAGMLAGRSPSTRRPRFWQRGQAGGRRLSQTATGGRALSVFCTFRGCPFTVRRSITAQASAKARYRCRTTCPCV